MLGKKWGIFFSLFTRHRRYADVRVESGRDRINAETRRRGPGTRVQSRMGEVRR